ncbi:glutamate racemase [Teredinibacter purpureus]|uniref:glutamate racemase n=1 Tax=Teredinibacter purpureus TaxID=2731756 RepID=UPI000698072D|nr:glutamate racemase [Teredinibacter purpureus]
MQRTPTILIFDSGAGGLSIAREIQIRYPYCDLVYVADNALFPYGLMDDSHLIDRVVQLMGSLIARYKPDITVIACNTASTIALAPLRKRFKQIFVGVVPAVKPAAETSSSSVIGLLATPATVDREYTNTLITKFAAHCHVYTLGSSQLVHYAEAQICGNPVDDDKLSDELVRLTGQDHSGTMDKIVLACTHFPLLKERFTSLGHFRKIDWIDSGEAIARRVGHHLADIPHNAQSSSPAKLNFVFTSSTTSTETKNAYRRYLVTSIESGSP